MISIREKIYSKAFEDGVNYAIQKMFNEEEEDKKKKKGVGAYIGAGLTGAVAGKVGGSLVGDHIIKKKYIPDPYQLGVDIAKGLSKDGIGTTQTDIFNATINPGKTLKEHGSKLSEDTKRHLETMEKAVKLGKRSSRIGALVGTGVGTGAVALYRHMKNKKQDN